MPDKKKTDMPEHEDKFTYGENDHLTIWDAYGNLVHVGGKPVEEKKIKEEKKSEPEKKKSKSKKALREEILRLASDLGIKSED